MGPFSVYVFYQIQAHLSLFGISWHKTSSPLQSDNKIVLASFDFFAIISSTKLMKRKIRRIKRRVHKLPALNIIIASFAAIFVSFFSFIAYSVYSAPQYEAQVRHVEAKDAKLAYYVRGKGEPIILLNGFGMTMQHWDPDFVQKLSLGNELIIIDYRGVGASTGKVQGISQVQMAEDVITVMDQLKIDRAHIIGWSLGSFVAQNVAQRYPNRVEQLVLLATAPAGEAAIPASEEIRNKVQKELAGTWEETYAPMMFIDQKDTKAYLERLKKAQAAREVPKTKGESLDAKIAHQLAFADPGLEQARYLGLEKIKAPTLLISGDKDALTPLENAKIVEKRIPNAELIVIPDAGHAPMFEEVNETVKYIKTFLREK